MNIIALFGDNSVGKTHTFNILYDELLKIAGVTSTGKTAFGKRDFEDILNFPFAWVPPKTSDDPLYTAHSHSKVHVELLGPQGIIKSKFVILPTLISYINVLILK